MVILALSISIIALATGIIILAGRCKTLNSQLSNLNSLWIVGQYRFGDTGAIVWDFQGVFTTEEKATAACKSATWFIAQMELDKELPETTEVMPEVSWPLLKETT